MEKFGGGEKKMFTLLEEPSCFAYAVTSAIEYCFRRPKPGKVKDIPDLSTQKFVDCSKKTATKKGSGGSIWESLMYDKLINYVCFRCTPKFYGCIVLYDLFNESLKL